MFVFADNLLRRDLADQTTGAGLWNGDDAIVLRRAARSSTRSDNSESTRAPHGVPPSPRPPTTHCAAAPSVCVGDTDPSNVFDPAAEWVGFAQDTFDGLGSHTADCGVIEPSSPGRSTSSRPAPTGTDVEYVELLAEPGTDLSGYRVLEIEGDSGYDHSGWSMR